MRVQFDYSLEEIQEIMAAHIRQEHGLRNYDIKFDWAEKPMDGVTCECTMNSEIEANRQAFTVTGGRKLPDYERGLINMFAKAEPHDSTYLIIRNGVIVHTCNLFNVEYGLVEFQKQFGHLMEPGDELFTKVSDGWQESARDHAMSMELDRRQD